MRGVRGYFRIGLTAAVIAVALVCAPAAQAEPVSRCNVPIRMSDGVTLRANLFLPAPDGRFSTVLTTTGYNKDVANPTGTRCGQSGGLVSTNPRLLEDGYAVMILDDRGTGASEGVWDSWGERTQDDYPEVLDWIQAQPWSDGQVATTGGSYMGITSLLMALADQKRMAAGKPRAVKTVWADVPMADAYRDVTFHGGANDAGFMPLWLGLTSALSSLPPSTLVSEPGSAAPTYAGHLANVFGFAGQKLVNASVNGDYDGPFYRLRSPVERISRLDIPVAWTGGWWDIFQRGEPLLYEEMTSSPRRVFWMTPNYHGAPDEAAWAEQGIGPEGDVQKLWFDRWLRGERNATDELSPVNLYTMGDNRWQRLPDWPVPNTRYTPYFLGPEKSLRTGPPAEANADSTVLLPASSPCSRLTVQWTAGLVGGPCETDNRTFEATALTYTTPPLEQDTEVTGLITADLWAELTSPDATLVAVLSDVDESGRSTQVTAGFLMASQRALDRERSTRGPGGEIIRPYHPFTRESKQAVPPNDPQRYRIEVYPTSNVFKAGHRIRLTLASANTPSTGTPVADLPNQAGGRMRLLHGPRYPSQVLLPLPGQGEPAPPARTRNPIRLPRRLGCAARRGFTLRLRSSVSRVRVRIGRRVVKRARDVRRVRVGRLPRGRFRLKVAANVGGDRFTRARTYPRCSP